MTPISCLKAFLSLTHFNLEYTHSLTINTTRHIEKCIGKLGVAAVFQKQFYSNIFHTNYCFVLRCFHVFLADSLCARYRYK